MGVGAAIAGTVAGGVIQARGAKKAAKAQRAGQQEALAAEEAMHEKNLAFQREQWDYQKREAEPYQRASLRGLGQYENMMRQPQEEERFDLSKDPLYASRIGEQTKAIERGGAARGGLLGGGTLRSLRDMTAGEMSGAYQRFGQERDYRTAQRENKMNRYANLAGIGQTTTQGLQRGSQQFAATVGNAYNRMGDAQSQSAQNIGAINAAGKQGKYNSLSGILESGAMMAGMSGMGQGSGYSSYSNRGSNISDGFFK